MSADLIILKSLESALAAAVADMPVAYQNIRFAPVDGQVHLESQQLPATTQNPTMGDGFERRPGIFQVTVVGIAGEGLVGVLTAAETVVAAFARGRTLHDADGVRVIVDESPSIGPGIPDEPWYRVPVSIPYLADVQPA